VVVDIRLNSPTFGKCVHVDLSAQDGKAVLIGRGLGHAFVSLAPSSIIAYLLSSPYSPTEEYEINPFDSDLQIDWKLESGEFLLSKKDSNALSIAEALKSQKLPRINFEN
jgi:dTDP-4-dehydrorhamnose 3,5-epimerase